VCKEKIKMLSGKKNISKGIKVANWITNGFPTKYGVQLLNNRFIPLKQMEWNFLQRIWHRLRQPDVFYYEEDNSIEFAPTGFTRR
jgi:hypothetical protein